MSHSQRPRNKLNAYQQSMLETIQAYNLEKDEEDQIKFLHGGTSASLAFMGKKVSFFDESRKSHREEEVPFALIPTGKLRKDYGLYPVSGERDRGVFGHGSRKAGANYHGLSGMGPNEGGVFVTTYYASSKTKKITTESLQHNIESLILTMDETTYLRNLKQLLMLTSNLMTIDPRGGEKAAYYLNLIDNEYHHHLKGKISTDDKFIKYRERIRKILSGEALPFKPDEKFIQAILNQFPVIYCSTVDTTYDLVELPEPPPGLQYFNFIYDELLHRGMVPLSTVKIMFTPTQHVEELKSALSALRNTDIGARILSLLGVKEEAEIDSLVYGYAPPVEDENVLDAFLKASTLDKVIAITQQHPYLLEKREIVLGKLDRCFGSYFCDGGALSSIEIAKWVVKNTQVRLSDQFIYRLYDLARGTVHGALKGKSEDSEDNPNYLESLPGAVKNTYEQQTEILAYFDNLTKLFPDKNLSGIFDYSQKMTVRMLSSILSNHYALKDQADVLHSLGQLLLVDQETISPDFAANLQERIDMVRKVYSKILKKDRTIKNSSFFSEEEPNISARVLKESDPGEIIEGEHLGDQEAQQVTTEKSNFTASHPSLFKAATLPDLDKENKVLKLKKNSK